MSRSQSDERGEAPDPRDKDSTTRGSKVKSEKVILLVLGVLMLTVIIVMYCVFENNIQRLRHENAALRINFTETSTYCRSKPCTTVPPQCPDINEVAQNQPCLKCETGWEQHGGHCYHFSTSSFNWSKSRDECTSLGGNLVKIDSRDEQAFLDKRLKEKMTEDEDKFWIGLTDSETEGDWLWVDGSKLNQSLVFWRKNEPDNWKGHKGEYPDGEDCARMGERGGAGVLNIWNDQFCTKPQKHICEKKAKTGHFTCV